MSTFTSNPVLRSTHAELLRLRKWPAVWVTLGAWLALAATFGYLFNYLAYATGSQNFATDGQSTDSLLAQVLPGNVPAVLVQGTPMFGGALMMVLGALVAGSGYGWGTWKTVFTQGPSRTSAVLGSMSAVGVFVLGLVMASTLMSFGLALGIAALEDVAVAWPAVTELATGMGYAYLILLMWALVGFGLGTLARGPALSVGLGLVWALVLENLLRGVGTLLGRRRGVHPAHARHGGRVAGRRVRRRDGRPGRDRRTVPGAFAGDPRGVRRPGPGRHAAPRPAPRRRLTDLSLVHLRARRPVVCSPRDP